MWGDTGEACGELGNVRAQIGDGSNTKNTVWVVTEDVRTIRRKVGGLDHRDGEVLCEPAEDNESAHPGEATTAIFGCSVNKEDPEEIGEDERPKNGEGKEKEEERAGNGQQEGPNEDSKRLQATATRDAQRSKTAMERSRKECQEKCSVSMWRIDGARRMTTYRMTLSLLVGSLGLEEAAFFSSPG